jgi:nitroreductase
MPWLLPVPVVLFGRASKICCSRPALWVCAPHRPAAKEMVGLPDNMEAFCLIPVGYPMGKFGPVTRLPVAETLRWDHWS